MNLFNSDKERKVLCKQNLSKEMVLYHYLGQELRVTLVVLASTAKFDQAVGNLLGGYSYSIGG